MVIDKLNSIGIHVYVILCIGIHVYVILCIGIHVYVILCIGIHVYVILCIGIHVYVILCNNNNVNIKFSAHKFVLLKNRATYTLNTYTSTNVCFSTLSIRFI